MPTDVTLPAEPPRPAPSATGGSGHDRSRVAQRGRLVAPHPRCARCADPPTGHGRRRRHRQHRRIARADRRPPSVPAASSMLDPSTRFRRCRAARPGSCRWRSRRQQRDHRPRDGPPTDPGADQQWIWLLHDDAEPDPRALEHLLAEVVRDPTDRPGRAQGARLVRPAAAAGGRRHHRPQRPARDAAGAPRAGPGPARRHHGRCSRSTPPGCSSAATSGTSCAASTPPCRCCATTSTSAGGPPWPATASSA